MSQHDPVVQAGLTVTLAQYDDLNIVAAETWWAAAEGIDVIVADYERGLGLLSAVTIQTADQAGLRVLVLTANARDADVQKALKSGVRGYVLAGQSLDTLANAVRDVHAGRIHLDPEVAQLLAHSLYSESLTAREEEILSHVVDGRCNKEIAALLDVAVGTVKSHLRAIFGKLEVGSRTQAVAAIAKRGLLRQDVKKLPQANWHGTGMRAQTFLVPRTSSTDVAADHQASSSLPREMDRGGSRRDGQWSLELARLWAERQDEHREIR